MNRFGVPLVPAALALIAMNFGDRFFLVHFAGLEEVGALRDRRPDRLGDGALLITAFRIAWPAFAYSIEDDDRGEADVRLRAHVPRRAASWLALALGLLSPWLVRLLARPDYYAGGRVVALLAFGGVAYAAYIVHGDRRRPREADAVQLGDHRRRRARQRRAQPRARSRATG